MYDTCIKLKTAKRKLQTELSLQQKSVLLCIQKGQSQRKLAEQYGMSKTTIRNIKKNEHSIINAVETNCSQNRKRKMRKTENEEVNNIILEFFIKCRAQNIPVTGPILLAKAAEIASSLQIEKFTATNSASCWFLLYVLTYVFSADIHTHWFHQTMSLSLFTPGF